MRQTTRPTLLLLSTALACIAPSRAQVEAQEPASSAVPQRSAQLDQLMSRGDLPTSLRLKGLDKSWRRVTVDAGEEGGSAFMYGMRGPAFRDILSDLGVGVYYTKWQSMTLGSETYLVAYRMQNNVSQDEMQDAFRQLYGGGHGDQPAPTGPRRFAPDTQLQLSLLNLRTSGSMVDIRAFDAARDIMGPRDIIEASNENLRRIGTYFPRMTQFERNGMRGLPMQNITSARDAFVNFFHAPRRIFVHPQTGQPYLPNTRLAGRRLSMISGHAQVLAFSEARPGSDGKRGVVFLDGHVERVPEAQWQSLSQAAPKGLSAAQINVLSLKSLQALNRQLRQFSRYGDGKLPPTSDSVTMRRALNRYGLGNGDIFSHPTTREAYRTNAALSGRKLAQISNPSRLVSFYEARPGVDGKRGAVFLDGHIERVPEARWPRVKSTKVQTRRTAGNATAGRRGLVEGY